MAADPGPAGAHQSAGAARDLEIEIAVLDDRWDNVRQLRGIAERAAACAVEQSNADTGRAELSLVFSNDQRIRVLNEDYRGKPSATNVLSFPAELPAKALAGQERLLGDVVFAFETITGEARAQGKTFENHLCHLIVHGVLHLLGYDHESDSCAQEMEALETTALALIGVPNPYENDSSARDS